MNVSVHCCSAPSTISEFRTRSPISFLNFPVLCRPPLHNLALPNARRYNSVATGVPRSSVTAEQKAEDRVTVNDAANPVYVSTPPHRQLRTPHSGYHFDGTARQFFEGWYFKVSIPEKKQNFCFMYTVENPAFLQKLTPIEEAKYGRRFTGVGAQILGADDKYICQYTEENQNFWGSRHKLKLGSTFIAGPNWQPPKGELAPEEFDRRVLEGFQVSPLWHQGCIQDDGRSDYVETVKTARWQYSTRPVYGWGNVGSKQKSTAGWLAVFPVFEPHWQICMSAGLSTGWIEWDGERFEFENAPSYSEKNWVELFPANGFGSFIADAFISRESRVLVRMLLSINDNMMYHSRKVCVLLKAWALVQCNVFEGANKEVALTAAGGLRQLAGGMVEDAALVGVHYDGIFYEFVPWNGMIEWEIAPWGFWKISADNGKYKVELEAITEHQGTTLRAPTLEAGLAPACKDSCYGNLKLQIWERRSDGARGKIILDVTSDMAAVEVGGGPWLETWKGTTTTPELVKHALSVPIDVESIFDVISFFKPPGL